MTTKELFQLMSGNRGSGTYQDADAAYLKKKKETIEAAKQEKMQQKQEHQEKLRGQLANYGRRNVNDQVAAKQAAQEKAMQGFAQEQQRKAAVQTQQSKYGLATSPTRQAEGKSYIDNVIDISSIEATLPANLQSADTRNMTDEEKLRRSYDIAVAEAKGRGDTADQILKSLGDFEQYKAWQESSENTVLPENLLERAQATAKQNDAIVASRGRNLSSLLMSLSAGDELAAQLMGLTEEEKKAIDDLNSIKGEAGMRAGVQAFRLNMPLVSLFDDFSASGVARKRSMDALSEWGVPVYQNTPTSMMSKGKNEPLTASEIQEIVATGDSKAIEILQAAGLDVSEGSLDMQLTDAEAIGSVVGDVAAEIAEYAIISAAVAPAAEANTAAKVTSSLSKGAKFFAKRPKLTAYLGKAAGDFIKDNTLDTALSISSDLMHGEDAGTVAKNAALNTVMNAAGSLIMPALPALGKKGRAALQESYDAATGVVKVSAESLADTLENLTKKEVADAAKDVLESEKLAKKAEKQAQKAAMAQDGSASSADAAKVASDALEAAKKKAQNAATNQSIKNAGVEDLETTIEKIHRAAAEVSGIPDPLKADYQASVDRQVGEMAGRLELDDAALDAIDYAARVEVGYKSMIETLNTKVRAQFGDKIADEIMSELGDALQSEAKFSDFMTRVYGDGGVFGGKSAQEYLDSVTGKIKDKESYKKWLESIEDVRWVSSHEVDSSTGYIDYVNKKLAADLKNDPSMAAVVDLSKSDIKTRHRFMESVVLAADEVTDLPHGVGAAEKGFSKSMKKEAADAIRDAEDPISEVSKAIGDEAVIVNASRSVSDAPLDATVTFGEGEFAKEMSGREYIDKIKSSPFMPKTPEAMNAHMEALNRDIARSVLMEDNESLTKLMLQKQAATEVAAKMDYDEYLKNNGELSSFIKNIVETDDVQNTPDLIDAVSGLEPRYLPRHRADQLKAARDMLSKEGGEDALVRRLSTEGYAVTAEDIVAAKLLADQMRNAGRFDGAASVFELVQQRLRENGRAVEAAKIFYDTPEMMVHKARKTVEQVAGKEATAALDDVSKAAHKADNAAVKTKAEKVADEFDQKVNATYQAQEKAIKDTATEIDNAVNRSQNSSRSLLNRITAAAKKSGNPSQMTNDDILTTRMVNDLFAIAKKSVDPKVSANAAKMDRWELARAALEDRQTYRSVWNEARALANQQYANDPEMLKTLETWTRQWLDETDTLDQMVAPLLTQALKEQGFKLSDFIDGNLGGDKVRVFAEGVADKLGLVGTDAENVTEYIMRKVRSKLDEPMQNLRSSLDSGNVAEQTLDRVISDSLLARGTTMRQIMDDYYAGDQADDLVEYIVKKSGVSGDNADRLREMLQEKIYSGMETIRAKEMEKLLKNSPAAKQLKRSGDRVNLLRKNSTRADKTIHSVLVGGSDSDFRNALANVYNVPTLSEDQAVRIMAYAQKLQGLDQNSAQYNRLFNEMLSIAAEEMYMRGTDAMAALIKTFMLSNVQTHITNIAGNATGLGIQKINNAFGVLAEKGFRKAGILDADQSMHSIGWANGDAGKARMASIKEWWDNTASFEYSKTGRWSDPRKNLQGRYDQVFKGSNVAARGFNKFSGFISNLLSKEDMIFAEQFYRQAAGSMMAAQGIETMTKEIHDRAMNEAMFYTFHRSNSLGKVLNTIKQIPVVGKVFDLTTMPFVGTTTDIFKQAIVDYNPLVQIPMVFKKVHSGDIYSAVDSAAKGMTGTAAYGLGIALSMLGVIKLNDTSSKSATLDRASREQDFSLQIGPVNIHVGNLQPYMIPVMQGATLAQVLRDVLSKSDEENGLATALKNALSSWAGVAMDNSMWSSIENILVSRDGSVQAGDVVGRMIENFAGSLVPAALGAIANSVDNTVRMSRSDNFVENAAYRMLSKIPFYTYTKEALIDMWGNEVLGNGVDGVGGTVLDTFNAVVNPFDITFDPYADDDLTNEVDRLYELGLTRAVPSTPSSTFDFDGKEYRLTDAEYADMCREIGQLRYTRAKNTMSSSVYQTADDDAKADMLAKRFSEAADDVRKRWKAKLARDLDLE